MSLFKDFSKKVALDVQRKMLLKKAELHPDADAIELYKANKILQETKHYEKLMVTLDLIKRPQHIFSVLKNEGLVGLYIDLIAPILYFSIKGSALPLRIKVLLMHKFNTINKIKYMPENALTQLKIYV